MAVATASLLALAACGGGGDDDSGGSSAGDKVDNENLGNTGSGTDPDRQGPVTIEGAKEGGTVNVISSPGMTTPIDPSDLYYTDTNAIMTSLVTRALTQYSYDADTGQMILVPDLATDLGTPNDDFTEWKFTLRDGVKWENGQPVTADEVMFGIVRSMDGKTFPNGPGLYYSNPYFLGGEDYKGPYTDPDAQQQAVSVDGNTITIKMATPFPDFPYYASFPAMGPIPTDPAVSDPAKYAQHPLATGPYKIEQYTIGKSMTLVRNDQWDPATDPARTAYPDSYVFKVGQQSEAIDQIMLADSGDGKTTIAYDDVLAQDYRKMDETGRLVTGGQPCTYFYALDQRKVPDKSIAEALTWAIPYNDQIVATGLIPDVNAVATQNLMPPGVPGREEYDPVEGHGPFQTDPEKAKQILADSGNEGFEIKFLFSTDSDVSTAGKDVLVKGLEAAGFKATPVATTLADSVADRDDVNGDINMRSYGWCSDWPSGATWVPPIFQSTDLEEVGFGTNEAAFNNP
ncbi:MAG TPA: ABC transporter substrate-binding protein, partial [Nocardioides sp.]|nr:ABC transporter substrate-binding protein [Nocardioides sp.]